MVTQKVNQLLAGMHIELAIDAFHASADGVLGYEELAGNCGDGVSFKQQFDNLQLAF